MVAQLFDAGALEQERPDDWERVLVYNAVTVLFGTVRTVYADLSAAGPTGRIVLPAVNVGQILDREAEAQVREAVQVAFGQAVARRIFGFAGGAEGLCLYQNLRSIERDLGFVDVMHSAPDGTTTYDQQLLLGTITGGGGSRAAVLEGEDVRSPGRVPPLLVHGRPRTALPEHQCARAEAVLLTQE